MERKKLLHILRNPYGFEKAEMDSSRIDAANVIEELQEAYKNMKEWAEKNGVDTTAYHGPKPNMEIVNFKDKTW